MSRRCAGGHRLLREKRALLAGARATRSTDRSAGHGAGPGTAVGRRVRLAVVYAGAVAVGDDPRAAGRGRGRAAG